MPEGIVSEEEDVMSSDSSKRRESKVIKITSVDRHQKSGSLGMQKKRSQSWIRVVSKRGSHAGELNITQNRSNSFKVKSERK